MVYTLATYFCFSMNEGSFEPVAQPDKRPIHGAALSLDFAVCNSRCYPIAVFLFTTFLLSKGAQRARNNSLLETSCANFVTI